MDNIRSGKLQWEHVFDFDNYYLKQQQMLMKTKAVRLASEEEEEQSRSTLQTIENEAKMPDSTEDFNNKKEDSESSPTKTRTGNVKHKSH